MSRSRVSDASTPLLWPDVELAANEERKLAALAVMLGAKDVAGISPPETALIQSLPRIDPTLIGTTRRKIQRGLDPLGDLFCKIRVPEVRREKGATYTPEPIVAAMVEWAAAQGIPERVIDPGVGSARYMLAAGRRFPNASLFGVEVDPLPALIARANLATSGMAGRAEVRLSDYRTVDIAKIDGRTLYIGNPPYVRHHQIPADWKAWLHIEAKKRGFAASTLAGLHVYFFLATVCKAAPQDFGAFITSAEWLDVNYGRLVRDLFLGDLGGRRIVVVEPTARPFPDAATTAAITYFEVGSTPKKIRLKRVKTVEELAEANGNRTVCRERLEAEPRWSHFTKNVAEVPEGFVELGELCRVHRGQVTGANRVWIAGPHSTGLPASVLFATVTKARELIRAGTVLDDADTLRRVIDLPVDLDVFESSERTAIERFLAKAKLMGVHEGYVAANRKAWWSVGLRNPAPILATYMARRPPAFVQNKADARHINIAHGLYPRQQFGEAVLKGLVNFLSQRTKVSSGRTYAGGLTKFEPREMERLLVPEPQILHQFYL